MGLFSKKIDTKKMVPVCRHLATAYSAGIPIIQSLGSVRDSARDGRIKRVFRNMEEDLRNGATLAQAAVAQSPYLSPFFIQLLASGERGGRLDEMLRELADYFEDRLRMQRQIRGMLFLPMIQLSAAWFLGSFAIRLIPKIMAGFNGRGGAVDLWAYLQEFLRFQGVAVGIFCAVIAVAVLLSRFGLLGWITGIVTTFIWPFSVITRKFGLARFFRSFALLLGSGLHIVHCIRNAAAVTANPYMERDLLKAIPVIQEGGTLVQAFSNTRTLTPLSREMLLIGEQSGDLERQMQKIAQYHLDEANHAIQIATKLLGALIVLAVGGVVLYVLVTFYTQLYGGMLDGLDV